MFEDSTLRLLIYDEIVRTGETPVVVTLTRLVGASLDDVRASLRRMHDAHMLVLQPTGEILMANPFSAVPTPFLTEVGGRRWFGNCIWDALGIIATLHADGRVLASCGSTGERMELSVSDGALGGQGTVHFALPARRWWEDIVFNWKTMLLFRSEEMVDRWCRNWGLPRGAILSPATCWALAREWYHDRRDRQWRRPTAGEAHALFNRLGLTGDFWKLN